MARFADLHLHTFHSDGLRSPKEVVDLAHEHKLGIIAISDHDSVASFAEIRGYATDRGITLLPAVELSTEHRGVDVHILGYGFDPSSKELLTRLEQFREVRSRRADAMAQKLIDAGYPITLERVRELGAGASIGRPHVARALVEAHVVKTIDEAFEKLLVPGGAGYVGKTYFTIREAVDLIHGAGGVTSIAHPTVYPDHRSLVEELLGAGVDGVEVLHPEVDEQSSRFYMKLAASMKKLTTGGSDDHGFEGRRSIGTIRVPESMIAPILERSSSVRL